MKPNIDRKGRLLRGFFSLTLLGVALAACFQEWPVWARIAFLGAGLFVAFEATRGWCLARACGIKTRF